jgi:DNA polymerase (family 10)
MLVGNAVGAGTPLGPAPRRELTMLTSLSRLPLGRAHMLASAVMRDARRAGLPLTSLIPLGSLRRFAPDIGDVSLLGIAAPEQHGEVIRALSSLPLSTRVGAAAAGQVTLETERGDVTVYLATPQDAGAALVWHTGSRRHTLRLQERALQRRLQLDRARLTRIGGAPVYTPSEDAVYRHLELPFIPPELREGEDEIAAAERGALPALVTELHIRGDLHTHSTWSDGRDPIDAMVFAAQGLGYEYVAITDHSERSLASRKLNGADIDRQRADIERLRQRVKGIEILHGIEVDIMHDGTLDFDDAQLEGFDIVLASLHDHGGHDGRTLTDRYLRAIRHPLVNVITHPANRSPARSVGYNVDFDALFAEAAKTGTAMEIDGAPGHLDMDGALARRAVSLGVTVAIDSDCHRADALGRQMRFGLGTARRGWIEPRHVLNTRSLADVRDFIARKRAGR